MGKIFNKGLDKDDKKGGLFKRLKNIENAQKNLIKDDDKSIYYTSRSEFDDNDDKDKKQQTNNIDTKPPNIFKYLKSLNQEAKNLMDEIKDAHHINDGKLLFIGNNKKEFNFNTFRKPLNCVSDIYNGKISLKEAEFKQKDLEKIIYELQFNYTPKDEKEKEKIDGVLMHANDLLEYRDKIIDAFKTGTFLYEHLKKSDDAAYNYKLKDVNKFIEKIKSMEEKINLSLKNFLNIHHQLIMQKCLLILKST